MKREEALNVLQKLHDTALFSVRTALETIIPELAESEDERIRKWIASYIHRGVFNEEEHPMALKAIEYLEKQKEQWIPTDEQRYALGMVIKHSNPDDESTKVLESLLDDLTKIANPKVAKWKEQRKEKQKEKERIIPEREPTDFEIEVHEIIAQARCDKRLADEAVLKQFEQEAACALMLKAEKQKEQKPAAWSEEDERHIESITRIIERYKEDNPASAEYVFGDCDDDIAWLKSLSSNLKKKNEDVAKLCSNEWSEGDENALNYLHELIGFGYSENFMDAQTAADMREWVNKSLREQLKQL